MSSNTLPVCPKTGSTSPSLTVHLCLHTVPGNRECARGGPLLTKTLLFIGQGIESKRLRAFDKDTGYELFEMELPARSSSAPISYLAGGRQYIVLAVGGGADREQLVALALP